MKTKYKSLKMTFLESKPKLLKYISQVKLDLDSIISIEHKDSTFSFRGLGFIYRVTTDANFSFFKSNLTFNEIVSEAG